MQDLNRMFMCLCLCYARYIITTGYVCQFTKPKILSSMVSTIIRMRNQYMRQWFSICCDFDSYSRSLFFILSIIIGRDCFSMIEHINVQFYFELTFILFISGIVGHILPPWFSKVISDCFRLNISDFHMVTGV